MIVDLTHPIDMRIPLWPGDPPVELSEQASVARQGYLLNRLAIGEHSGTHVGAAAHMREGGRTVDRLEAKHLVLPAFVIDVRERCDARFRLGLADVAAWESANVRIGEGSAVLLCAGWSSRWPDAEAYLGSRDGSRLAWPGFSIEAAKFLSTERGVIALGIDTHGIDAGDDTELSVNSWWLDGDRYHIENLTHLEMLPPTGATLFVGVLPIRNGGGAPARVLATFETSR